MVDTKPNRMWQNLFYRKCPNCNERLEDAKIYLKCPNPHESEPDKNCFFIKKEVAAKVLLDPKHPANFCLNVEEKSRLEEIVMSILSDEDE